MIVFLNHVYFNYMLFILDIEICIIMLRFNSSVFRKVLCSLDSHTSFKLNPEKVLCRYFYLSSYHHHKNDRSKGKSQNKFWSWFSFNILNSLFIGAVGVKAYSLFKQPALAAESDPTSEFGGSSKRKAYNFVADVVDIVGNGVVYIEKQQMVKDIFTSSYMPVAVTSGSGFIVDPKGLIITNAHVVGNKAGPLTIKLPDGQKFDGKVVGIDEIKDIAAVKIDGRNLPSMVLGSTLDLRCGEWVVAIGSPLSLKNTVTAGIVSNTCRVGKELGFLGKKNKEMEYIQTDAGIDAGNSGGPLVNLDGQVIGVNTMGASSGIGFAIPIHYVKEFLSNLKQEKNQQTSSINRGRYVGITMLSLTPDRAANLRMRGLKIPPNITSGVYVMGVHNSSPASLAGMQESDVIVEINGSKIDTSEDAGTAINRDQVLNITVLRGDRTVVFRIVGEDLVH